MYKAIILDIDGCLSSDVGVPFNLSELIKIQEINRKSQYIFNQNIYPLITLNSGRPHAYCEAVSQMIGNYTYFIFENGAGISKSNGINYEYILDEKIDELLLKQMEKIFRNVIDHYGKNRFVVQPNKIYAKTLLFEPNDPLRIDVWNSINKIIDREKMNLYSEYGYNFINLNIKGINKGSGLDLFRNTTKIDYSEMVGVGDSFSDKNFMEKCGFKACPSNASNELKEISDYVSKYPDIFGTIDIVNYIIELNKK